MATKKLKLNPHEKISILPYGKTPKGNRYAVTNHGRVISFTDTPLTGNFRKLSNISGYPGVSFRIKDKNKGFSVHRLVAKQFLKQPSKKHKVIIHLNFNKNDNHYKNLKWATVEEQFIHFRNSPNKKTSSKLTVAQVQSIKKLLQKGKLSLKEIGKKFGVSDMQIFRIKTGENWGHIKI